LDPLVIAVEVAVRGDCREPASVSGRDDIRADRRHIRRLRRLRLDGYPERARCVERGDIGVEVGSSYPDAAGNVHGAQFAAPD
jgi:hypothetical protein